MKDETFVPNPMITRQVMLDYEKVRQSGKSNMFDIQNVAKVCYDLNCQALVDLIASDMVTGTSMYVEILKHFSKYMKMYDIKQPRR